MHVAPVHELLCDLWVHHMNHLSGRRIAQVYALVRVQGVYVKEKPEMVQVTLGLKEVEEHEDEGEDESKELDGEPVVVLESVVDSQVEGVPGPGHTETMSGTLDQSDRARHVHSENTLQ